MATEELSSAKRVVIVGGGVAGALLAKTLQFRADVTLIDPKEYFEIPWANLRSMVEPSFAKRSVIRHTDYFKNGRIITSHAINITDTEVLTADGLLVPYDYLVIATGHADSAPKARTEKLQQYEAEYQKIKSADSILIIGGGPTGVELAGEIAVDFPEKKVTLVHRGSRLLEFIGPKASKKTLDWLISKKVEVILEQSVDLNSVPDGDGTYKTSGGETIRADCHYVCIGQPTGSAWLKETILKDMLDMHGRLKVDENLRVIGRKNIFAIGDITDIQEIKQGYIAHRHALLTAKNLKLLMNGEKESKLEKYKPGSPLALVSLGRKEGVAQLPFTTIIGCIPGYIKSKDMFVGKTRKEMGLQSYPAENE
ncbi:apoptosis-inducing factor homolog B-like [Telopea speciosissima]|uniref:apoptosis-inducing factor homolog B-like n=1 Tax=Telopea speciosissima TaxID=54955 RepID=UPI001CC4D282|nr:apoptosis-inducing factor homolog B-like [Telopea speciosissima]